MQAKIYVSRKNADYYRPRTIMVAGKYGDDAIRYSEGRQMGNRCFFDNRYFVMGNDEFHKNFEPLAGKED